MIYCFHHKKLYLNDIETKRLNESVKRNAKRFPESFCFQLTEDEYADLRSQIATSNTETENASSKGGRRYLPYAFTEQGIAMLSAVLRSDEAIQVRKACLSDMPEWSAQLYCEPYSGRKRL